MFLKGCLWTITKIAHTSKKAYESRFGFWGEEGGEVTISDISMFTYVLWDHSTQSCWNRLQNFRRSYGSWVKNCRVHFWVQGLFRYPTEKFTEFQRQVEANDTPRKSKNFWMLLFLMLVFAELHQQGDTELLGNVSQSSLHCIGFCHEFCSQPYGWICCRFWTKNMNQNQSYRCL